MKAVKALRALAIVGRLARNGRLRHALAFGAEMEADRGRGIETESVNRRLTSLCSDQSTRMDPIDRWTDLRAVEFRQNAKASVLTATLRPDGSGWPIAGHQHSIAAQHRGEASTLRATGKVARKAQQNRYGAPITNRAARRSLNVHDASVERGGNASIIFSPSQASAREAAI